MNFQNERDSIPFIRMYATNECLWNYRLETYKRNDLKEMALEQLGNAFDLTVLETRKKIKNIRDTYNTSKKRLCKRQCEVDAGVLVQPKLFWYNEMAFLDVLVASTGGKRSDNTDVSIILKVTLFVICSIYLAYIIF